MTLPLPPQPRLIREREVACFVAEVRLTAHLLQDAVLFVATVGAGVDETVAAGDDTSVATATASLHWFPVASMPPPVPPEQSWAWAGSEKNIAAMSGAKSFAFMCASILVRPGWVPGQVHETGVHDSNVAPVPSTCRDEYSRSARSKIVNNHAPSFRMAQKFACQPSARAAG
jgi:hypothetical protein